MGAWWLIWVAVALGAAVVEILSLQFVLLMVAGGALLAALTAAVGLPATVQVVVFAATTTLLLLTARPALKQWAGRVPAATTGTAALLGSEAVVVEAVSEREGRVKLAGEVWSARSAAGEHLEVGSSVRVERIDGATAVVAPLRAQPPA